jgi:hypothetical protein
MIAKSVSTNKQNKNKKRGEIHPPHEGRFFLSQRSVNKN